MMPPQVVEKYPLAIREMLPQLEREAPAAISYTIYYW